MAKVKINAIESKWSFSPSSIKSFKNKVPKLNDVIHKLKEDEVGKIYHDSKTIIVNLQTGIPTSMFNGANGMILTHDLGANGVYQVFNGFDAKNKPLSGHRWGSEEAPYLDFEITSSVDPIPPVGDGVSFSKASSHGEWTMGLHDELIAEVPAAASAVIQSADSYIGNFSCEVEFPPLVDNAKVILLLGPRYSKMALIRSGTEFLHNIGPVNSPPTAFLSGLDPTLPFKCVISLEWIEDQTIEITVSTESGEVIVLPLYTFTGSEKDRIADVKLKVSRS